MSTSERPLHILILSDRDWTHPQGGGTGTNLFGQVSRWMAWGHRVSVIACSYAGAAPVERIGDSLTIYRAGGRSTVFPRTILRQWRGGVAGAPAGVPGGKRGTIPHPPLPRTPPRAPVAHNPPHHP